MSGTTTSRRSNTAEFANLFELFDRIATHRRALRAQAASGDDGESDEDYEFVPRDVDPAVRNFASLVLPQTISPSTSASNGTAGTTGRGRGRSNTVAATGKFPLGGKQYPFTFKMMLHKLYELEDWGKKVKEVLEKSQTQYRSLAEKEMAEGSKAEKTKGTGAEKSGKVHFATGLGLPGGKRAPRGRSTSLGGAATQKAAQAVQATKPTTIRDDLRAVKRRCVGRRKSITKLDQGETDIRGAWVYESAVASVDRDSRERNEGTMRRRRISTTAGPASAGGASPATKRPVVGRSRRAQTVSTVCRVDIQGVPRYR